MYFYRIHYRKQTLFTEVRIDRVVKSSIPLNVELLQKFINEKKEKKLRVILVEKITEREYEEVKKLNSFSH